MPLSLHVGTYRWRPGTNPNDAAQDIVDFHHRECDARNAIAAMIYAGCSSAYPKLRVEWSNSKWLGPLLPGTSGQRLHRARRGRKLHASRWPHPQRFLRRNVFISSRRTTLASSSAPLSVFRT